MMPHPLGETTTIRTKKPRRSGGQRRGFTLVEMIAVLVLVGIISVVGMASMGALESMRCAAAAKAIARDVSYARERAMSTGTRHWLLVDITSDSISVLAEDPAATGRAGAITITDPASQLPFVTRLNAGAHQGVRLLSVGFDDATEIGFDKLGRPLTTEGDPLDSDGYITLSGGHTIIVAAGNGMVTHAGP